MHVLPRPHLSRQLGVVMAATLAIAITLVLLVAVRSVGSASVGTGTPPGAALTAPAQAADAGAIFGSGTHVRNVPTPLRWGTSPIPASLRIKP